MSALDQQTFGFPPPLVSGCAAIIGKGPRSAPVGPQADASEQVLEARLVPQTAHRRLEQWHGDPILLTAGRSGGSPLPFAKEVALKDRQRLAMAPERRTSLRHLKGL